MRCRADGLGLDRRRHPDRMVVPDRGGRVRTGTGARPRPVASAAGAGRSRRIDDLRSGVLELAKGEVPMADTATSMAPAAAASEGIEKFRNYIDGEWSASRAGEYFDDVNPADTSDIVGRFPASCAEDAEAAVRAA